MIQDFEQKIDIHSPVSMIGSTLTNLNIRALIIANINGEMHCSHESANFLIPIIQSSTAWRNHEAVIIKPDEESQCLYILSIHSTVRGRPEGGVRLDWYENFEKALSDSLRLSHGMTLKNANAEIWEGGAKCVIVPYSNEVFKKLRSQKKEDKVPVSSKGEKDKKAEGKTKNKGNERDTLWKNFGKFLSSLQGLYLAGEDVNLNSADMSDLLQYCVHVSCLDQDHGGCGNPSPYTAHGIYLAIKAGIEFLYPENQSLKDKRILVKGIGNVGYALIRKLIEEGAYIIIHDFNNTEATERARLEFSSKQIEIIDDFDQFISTTADVFSPNSTSLSINKEVTEKLNVKMICGAENGQLEKDELAETLHRLGIVYIPEPCVNSMGVFSAYQEHRGILYSDFEVEANKLYDKTKRLLSMAKAQNKKPFDIFIEEAGIKARIPHPIDGHRGIKIIKEIFNSWKAKI